MDSVCHGVEYMTRAIFVGPLVLASVWLLAPSAQKVGNSQETRTARFLLIGLKDSRERLRSGVFRATGRLRDDFAKSEALDGAVDVLCAFDYSRDLFRFDRRQPMRWKEPGDWIVRNPFVKFIRTPEFTAHFDENIHRVFLRAPDAKPAPLLNPWNIRLVGLVPENSLDETFDTIYSLYSAMPDPSVRAEGKQVYRIAWMERHDWGDTLHAVWIDEAHGFSPLRYEFRDRRPSDPSQGIDGNWPEPLAVSEATWIQERDVWIPRAFVAETRGFDHGSVRFDITLDWEVINQPVSDRFFNPASFEAPGHWRVVDERLGRPIELGKVESVYPPMAPTTRVIAPRVHGWMLAIGGLSAVAVTVLLYLRWRREHAAG
jgi:hypothetical protein